MSRADELKAAVRRSSPARAGAAPSAPPPAVEPPAAEAPVGPTTAAPVPTRAPRAPSTSRVRRTVDLGPADHRALTAWCNDTAEELGRARVTGQDVLSALVARLVRDDTLSTAIRNDLRHQ